ncbi:GHKL domain-containing protein [Vagococcus vulneris]|uniref:Uncharacterized protein n=1 Tax=Vagococcus vulneris TaxID=1977869 RepID=A0A430A1H4_9ENTE|nr:GHKL domain-containing protein [Vagococcus vulneris]RSU00233.1 hypothetical protein CBF37_02750 [Vagococcus vulneris]
MNKKEYTEVLNNLLDNGIEGLSQSDTVRYTKEILIKYEKKKADLLWEKENYKKSWTDDELKVVLSTAPTEENILLMAKGFKRGTGSIELIYRWASTPQYVIKDRNKDDVNFIKQIKRVAKEIGWRGF